MLVGVRVMVDGFWRFWVDFGEMQVDSSCSISLMGISGLFCVELL